MEFLSRSGIDYEVEDFSLAELFNYNEMAVLNEMREQYARDRTLCRCELCLEDTYALALNSLPPRYVQETRVAQYEESSTFVGRNEVREKVLDAIARVRANPNH